MNLPSLSWAERFFISAFTVNENGIGELVLTETTTTGDPLVSIKGKYASQSTPNASVVALVLPWPVAASELWAIDIIVTAKSADAAIRRRIKMSAIIWGNGATATLDAAADVDAKGTGNATANITVAGSNMKLELHPVDATALVWGFEVRGQRL